MLGVILAAAFTFTATATGVEKGTPIEFLFAGKDSDRDYETMFLLDLPIADFCREMEKAGMPRGVPTDVRNCRLWPVGCPAEFKPGLEEFIDSTMPKGLPLAGAIYTGGTRGVDDVPEAATNMPAAVFSLYTLSQAPFVFNGIYAQGDVYGCHTAKRTLKKGERFTFTVNWNADKAPRRMKIVIRPGNAAEQLKIVKEAAEKGEIDLSVEFDGELTVAEATAAANAFAMIDSQRVKINGVENGKLFYRAFMPLVKWIDRKERLVQPFELTINGADEKLLFIEEDWTVDGDDPKLTPREITLDKAAEHPKTDTCFIFTSNETRLSQVYLTMTKLKGTNIRNWYVFAGNNQSSHNGP